MDNSSLKKTKARLQNACDNCRKRKVRCDSGTMPNSICSSCLSAGIECKHSNIKKKRGPKPVPKKGIETSFESTRSLISCILAEPETYPIPEGLNSVRAMLVEISRYAFYLQKQLDRPDRKLSAQTNTASGSPISATPQLADSPSLVIDDTDIEVDQEVDADTISERLEKLSLSTHKDNRHFGPSSNFVLVQTLFDYKEEATGQKPDFHVRRPQFWQIYPWQRDIQKRSNHALVFPEPDLLYKLVDIYFTRFEPYFPLLHRRTFERSIAEGLHKVDTGFGQVLLAVCAVASKGSDDPRNLPDGVDNLHAMGWRWYSQISVPTSSFIESARLYDLQLCVLMSTYLQSSSISESAWILIGIGMRLAQAAGIHRKRPGHRRTVERELWIRAFWAIMIYDTFVSMFLGRPRVTTTDDFDAEYPTDCDQEFWENTDPENEFVQPSDKPSKSTFWIQFIKLMEIAGLTHRLIYPVRKSKHWKRLGIQGISWYQKSVMELDSALNEWVNAVPEHLKWDPNRSDDILFNQSVMLYSSYYWVQIQVHKSFIPRPDQNTILTGFPSLTICANAARSCIHIVEAQSKRWGQFPIAIPLGSVFTSAIMLLINFWRGKRMNPSLDTGTEMREVHKCFELLRPFEHRFQGAGRMIDILNEIISVGRLTIPPNEPPPSVDLDQDLVKKTDSSLELSNGTVGFPPASFSSLDSDNGQLDAQGFFQKTHPLPFNSNELGLLPLYSSDLTAFPQIPPSAYRSAEDVHSMLSRSDIMYPASANSATLADLGALGIGINFDSNYSSSPSNGPTDAHSRIPSATNHFFHQAEMPASPWGSLSDNTSAYSALDSGESGKDWTLFMRNVDELLRSASTDFRMTVDEA